MAPFRARAQLPFRTRARGKIATRSGGHVMQACEVTTSQRGHGEFVSTCSLSPCCWVNDEQASWLSAEERAVAKVLPGDDCKGRLKPRKTAHTVRQGVVARLRPVHGHGDSRCPRGRLILPGRSGSLARGVRIRDKNDAIERVRYPRSGTCQNEDETRDNQPYETHPTAPPAHGDSLADRPAAPQEAATEGPWARGEGQSDVSSVTRMAIPSSRLPALRGARGRIRGHTDAAVLDAPFVAPHY